jgi:hypothetical protein
VIFGLGPGCPARKRRDREADRIGIGAQISCAPPGANHERRYSKRASLCRHVLGIIIGVTFPLIAGAEVPTIRWLTDVTPNAVEVDGLAADTLSALARKLPAGSSESRVFAVFAEPAAAAQTGKTILPPMAGTSRVVNSRLRFEPQFPLVHGVRYRAEYRPGGDSPVISWFELPPRTKGRPTEVVQIFPSSDLLPENQLKFYVQFSAAMSRGGTYEHVHIRDADGRVIDLPFLELDEELWDPGMTRLTLLIDPGRIKRGVKPLEDIGPVFEQGKTYSLTLDASCRDALGQPLRQTYEKRFRIGPADRTAPEPQRWKIEVPKPGTRDPLVVAFDEPMDQALALRLIRVVTVTQTTTVVTGDSTLGRDEREWRFTPQEPWRRGNYGVSVATTIEDLAGNNIGKTFDVDLSAGAQSRVIAENVRVPFQVK